MKRSVEEISATRKPLVVVIVGASFGGLSTALRLIKDQAAAAASNGNKSSNEASFRVIILDKKDTFTIGGLWQFVWNHRLRLDQVTFDLKVAQAFLKQQSKNNSNNVHVELRTNTTVTSWDPAMKQVILQEQEQQEQQQLDADTSSSTATAVLPYDSIVVSCGVVTNPASIPGLEQCLNICTFETVQLQTEQVQTFMQTAASVARKASEESTSTSTTTKKKKATFVLAIGAVPYKCPVAPFELTCLLEESVQRHQLRDHCRIVITCPTEWPMPPSTRPQFQHELDERGIEFLSNHVLERVTQHGGSGGNDDDDAAKDCKILRYQNGVEIEADLVWSIHPLQAPDFVRDAIPESMIVDGCVNIEDQLTHQIPGLSNAFVIGDCCRVELDGGGGGESSNMMTMPKAGEFAWKMGQSVADCILESTTKTTDRTGRCIAELGSQKGIIVENNFSHMMVGGAHKVNVETTTSSEQMKIDWVNGYLRQIFGDSKTLSLEDLATSGNLKTSTSTG